MGWLEIDRRSRLPDTVKTFAPLREKILSSAARFNLTVQLPRATGSVKARAVKTDLIHSEMGEGEGVTVDFDQPARFENWPGQPRTTHFVSPILDLADGRKVDINDIPRRLFNPEEAAQEFPTDKRQIRIIPPGHIGEPECDFDTSEGKTRIPAAWACDVIAVTLWHWQRNPMAAPLFPFESENFPYGDWVAAVESPRYIVDTPVRGPNPNESFAKFEGRVLPGIREQLRRDWSAARGGSGKEKTAQQHFEWFARFQVGMLDPSEIVAGTNSPHTIQQSLKPTAQLLGLTARSAQKGRPKKRI